MSNGAAGVDVGTGDRGSTRTARRSPATWRAMLRVGLGTRRMATRAGSLKAQRPTARTPSPPAGSRTAGQICCPSVAASYPSPWPTDRAASRVPIAQPGGISFPRSGSPAGAFSSSPNGTRDIASCSSPRPKAIEVFLPASERQQRPGAHARRRRPAHGDVGPGQITTDAALCAVTLAVPGLPY